MKHVKRALVSVVMMTTPLLTTVSSTTLAATLNIMPLGDSITDILIHGGSLYFDLKEENIDFEFVGTQGNEPLKHEGRPGITIDGIVNNEAWNKSDTPDIILLMAGVNDFIQQGDSSIKAVTELQELYLQILEDLPNVELYVASAS